MTTNQMITTNQIHQLSNEDLLNATVRAAEAERSATVGLIRLLMEVDRRKLFLEQGYSSMFVFCTRALRLSEHAAYSRITAARSSRRFPYLLKALAEGDLSLSTVGLLAPHLDEGNCAALIEAARGKSTRDVERQVAAVHSGPRPRSSVRALPAPVVSGPIAIPPLLLDARVDSPPPAAAESAVARPSAMGSSSMLDTNASGKVDQPAASRRYVVKIAIDESTHAKLQELRALMRHQVPSGDPAEIIDRALTALLEKVRRQKCGVVSRPKSGVARAKNRRGPASRAIPAAVRRDVWSRDEGRCAFVGVDGRCNESAFVEFHHVVPFARGGASTTENVQLRCRAHNFHEAVRVFGERHMTQAVRSG